MINVLIADDNTVRAKQTCDLLSELKIPSSNITCVNSLLDAKKHLSEEKYDLLLLDLVLPIRNGAEPRQTAGVDLLSEISASDIYKMPSWIFAISAFDEAIQATEDITLELPCHIIKYESNSNEWRMRLTNYVDQILRAELEEQKTYGIDAAIICALEYPELAEIKRLPFNWRAVNNLGDSTDYFAGTFQGKDLICAAAYEMGLSATAILTSKITEKYHPRYLIMTGITGGVDAKKLHFGDVIVADPCYNYESGKRTCIDGKSSFAPDPHQVRLDPSIVQRVHRLADKNSLLQELRDACPYNKPDTPLKLHIGPMGSGASVLSDKNIINSIREYNRKALGFDMEGYALMLAGALASDPKPIPVVIKSVSDFGEGKNDDYQKYAAYTSAHVMMNLLEALFSSDVP